MRLWGCVYSRVQRSGHYTNMSLLNVFSPVCRIGVMELYVQSNYRLSTIRWSAQ